VARTEAVISFLPGAVSAGDVYEFIPCFKIAFGEESTRVWVYLSGMAASIYRAREPELTDAELNRWLVLYALDRINGYLETPGGFSSLLQDPGTWTIGADSLADLDAVKEKVCRYQRSEAGDLLCLASTKEDQTRLGSTGVHMVAPTSRYFCGTCQIPDSRVICSHLSHPEVIGIATAETVVRREAVGALCEMGQPQIQNLGACRAGENPCWTRTVPLALAVESTPPGLALPEAFDFLDAIWRLAFGSKKGLISLASVSEAAGLTLSCASSEDLDNRLSDLADVIDRLKVSDDLIGDAEVEAGSLNRIERVLRQRLDGESLAQALKGLGMVRRARQLRNARQHSGAAPKFPKLLAEMGLAEVPPDWAALWDGIKAYTTRGLMLMRTELRRLAESGES
jgi:hypothetical protein